MPFALNEGVRIAYERVGTGSPLVLMHGWSQSRQDLREWGIVDALRGDHEVIAMDARGHGASDKPHDPAAYRAEALVADVLAVLDDAGRARATLFGYSMGGMVGYAAAASAPDRFDGFIIGGAHPYAGDPEGTRRQAEALREEGMAAYVGRLERAGWTLPPAFRARKLANDVAAQAAALIAMGERPSYAETLQRLRAPMLVFAGDKDQPTHDEARRAAAESARVTFVSLPGATHAMAIPGTTHPEGLLPLTVKAIVPPIRRFLAGIDTADGAST